MDVAALEQRYKTLQRLLHPDKASGRPPEQAALSAALSTAINNAYAALRSPLARANYMVCLKARDRTTNVKATC